MQRGVVFWQTTLFFMKVQADRGFATSRLCSDEDGTFLAHFYTVRIGTSKKGRTLRGLRIK